MQRFLAFLVAAAVLGLAVGWFLHRGAGSVEPMPAPNPTERSAQEPAHALETAGKEIALRTAASSEGSASKPGEVASGPALARTALVVRVMNKVDGSPLARVRVRVRAANSDDDTLENVDAARGDLAHAPISDSRGEVEVEVPSGTALVVTAASEDEHCGMTAMDVHALSAGEKRAIELHVPCGEDLRFFGRLVDRGSKLPIAGASVRMMRVPNRMALLEAGQPKPSSGAWNEVRSDARGAFDLAVASWTQPYLRIEAVGYGTILALIQPGHESAERAQELTMSRDGLLHAFVLDAAEKPIPDTTLVLKARGFDLDNGGDEQQPGTWMPLPDVEWKARLDDHGGCSINRLPAGVPLAVEILKDGKLISRIGEPLRFAPGQVVERTWKIGAGARIEGRIVDQYATPVANHEVWLMSKSGPGEGYLSAYMRNSAIAKATSDGRGAFVLEDIDVGTWSIAAAPLAEGAAAGSNDVASWTQTVEVTGPGTQSILLTVSRGLLVSGHVLDPDGKPLADTSVTCTQNGEWFPRQTHTDEQGAFAVGPLRLGTCTLWAGGHDGFADSEQVTAEVGATDVVLRLSAAGWITGKVVDAATGDPCAAIVHVVPEHEHGPTSSEMETETQENGHFMIEGLLPDRYDLSFATTDGRCAVSTNVVVTAGHVSGDLVVKVLRGGVLSIRNAAKVAGTSFKVASGPVTLTLERGIGPDARESISVPAGRVTVRYWTLDEKRTRSAHQLDLDVGVGETREVVLRDDG